MQFFGVGVRILIFPQHVNRESMTLVTPNSLLLSTAPPRCAPEDAIYPLPHRIHRLLSNSILPIRTQNRLRDNGSLRSFVDTLIKISASLVAMSNTKAAINFIRLTRRMKIIKYGEHDLQRIELFFPDSATKQVRGLVYFAVRTLLQKMIRSRKSISLTNIHLLLMFVFFFNKNLSKSKAWWRMG